MSKGLEALEILYNNAKLDRDRIEAGGIVTYAEEIEHNERIKPYYETIKQYILKAQEQEKVLNILKEKCLYNDNLNYVGACINYDMYKEKMSELHDTAIVKIDWTCKEVLECLRILTQDEFNTVREWVR